MILANVISYPFFKIYETSCLFWKIDNFSKLHINVTLLSLNNISEFKNKIFVLKMNNFILLI